MFITVSCWFFAGLVCRVHRAPGAVWVFEPLFLRVSADANAFAHQQPHGDPIRCLQDLQALPQTLLPPRRQHGRVAGQQEAQRPFVEDHDEQEPLPYPPFQIAFEVLSFVSVVSNCWLLLLSPRLQELLEGGGVSSTNIVLLAVLAEVRMEAWRRCLASVCCDADVPPCASAASADPG